MSQRKDNFVIPLNTADAMEICRKIIADAGWLILDRSEINITAKEGSISSLFTNPVKLNIECESVSGGTRININGKNFGMGPIQSKHVVGQIGKFRNLIELAVMERKKKE
ncbi:hypothetical protein KGQ34_00230 [Patescibacteria group bacterium]|nr:hypothetical protein [Patescibacteria group bacterium]